MHFVLVVPDLLALGRAAAEPARATALARLLAAAGAPARAQGDCAAALAARYGVRRQDDWPLAPMRAAALGVDPGRAYWIAADPVSLAVGLDDVALRGVVADLDATETQALVATLNAHFAADGVEFVAPRPDAVFARVASPPHLVTPPLSAAADRPLSALRLEGRDAPTWRRWQNEIQMLLHAHPVNVARERTGRAPVNSLWFSDGGTMPPHPAPPPAIRTYASRATIAALAAFAGTPCSPLPEDLDAALRGAVGAETLVAFVDPPTDARKLETAWSAPAWQALCRSRLAEVSIVAEDAGETLTWSARRPPLLRRIALRFERRGLAAVLDLGASQR